MTQLGDVNKEYFYDRAEKDFSQALGSSKFSDAEKTDLLATVNQLIPETVKESLGNTQKRLSTAFATAKLSETEKFILYFAVERAIISAEEWHEIYSKPRQKGEYRWVKKTAPKQG